MGQKGGKGMPGGSGIPLGLLALVGFAFVSQVFQNVFF
jgi:hypothetical protein